MNKRIVAEKHKLKQNHLNQCANIINRSKRWLDVCACVRGARSEHEQRIPFEQREIKAESYHLVWFYRFICLVLFLVQQNFTTHSSVICIRIRIEQQTITKRSLSELYECGENIRIWFCRWSENWKFLGKIANSTNGKMVYGHEEFKWIPIA